MPNAIQLHIPEPCQENWQQMTPNEQGRHCMACQKTVVDFSVMSDREILNYISNASSSVCGHFYTDQLGKDLAINKKKRKFSLVYLWNLLIATLLITSEARSQACPPIKGKVRVDTKPRPPMMGAVALRVPVIIPSYVKGNVTNATDGSAIPGASITIVGKQKGVFAAEDGSFHIKWPKRTKSTVIEISAVGYQTQTIDVNNRTDWKSMEIQLQPEAEVLDSVTVVGYGWERRSIISGGTMVVIKTSKLEKIKNTITDWLPGKKEVQAYPNPVIKGNSINLKLNLKETGEYKMELLDVSGRVLLVQPVMITAKEQSASVPTNTTWSNGVYWVRLTGKNTKKTYQSKVLLQ